jgi:phosphoglycolate phosphatase-like HAD superfamily hydrolase
LVAARLSRVPEQRAALLRALSPSACRLQRAQANTGSLVCRCVVIEDSHIGCKAAKAAGMHCIVTTSSYTADEDFSGADAVFECIGEGSNASFSMADLKGRGKLALA